MHIMWGIFSNARRIQSSIFQSNWTKLSVINRWSKTTNRFKSINHFGNYKYLNRAAVIAGRGSSSNDSFTECRQNYRTPKSIQQQGDVLRIFTRHSTYNLVHQDVRVCNQVRLYSTNRPKPKTLLANEKTDEEKNQSHDTTAKKAVPDLDVILTVPNILTTIRMALAPVLGYLVLDESYALACGVFVFAGLTDLLDGFIARNFPNQTSALGSFIDPLADKLLISVLFISLTAVKLLPVALTALVVSRDVCLMSAGFYVRYISLDPRPKNLREFFDITNASAKLQPTLLSKANTAVQLSVVAFTLAAPVFDYVEHPALQALWFLTAATTIGSGVGYVFAKDTFKLMKQKRTRH